MIDLHCHILPGLDDGPVQWTEAVQMARLAFEGGVHTIVATPHVSEPAGAERIIRDKVAELGRRLQDEQIALQVLPGAEVSPLHPPGELAPLTLGGAGYILVEFPRTHLPRDARESLLRLAAAGLRPIVAHPERNPSVIRDPELLFDLMEAGALAQVTASSLRGASGGQVRACARYLLKRGAVHLLATDAHSCRERSPDLAEGKKAAARIIGHEAANKLVRDHPQAVLSGRALDD